MYIDMYTDFSLTSHHPNHTTKSTLFNISLEKHNNSFKKSCCSVTYVSCTLKNCQLFIWILLGQNPNPDPYSVRIKMKRLVLYLNIADTQNCFDLALFSVASMNHYRYLLYEFKPQQLDCTLLSFLNKGYLSLDPDQFPYF